jgi:hypothetical protein
MGENWDCLAVYKAYGTVHALSRATSLVVEPLLELDADAALRPMLAEAFAGFEAEMWNIEDWSHMRYDYHANLSLILGGPAAE